ncbi:leucine-rich repeat extensin-like protein 3 [Neltuma alba]|uniref:leucine-rich repeat extensin-like protein 3 n=1 Tax=Neltuma alba TaxID=207710 RepID=UPI0010A3E96C|nr:leucine-rich repeat extensin-like protein 3 [Prosopis alba]
MGGDGTPTGFGPRAHGSPLRPPPPPRHLSPPRPRHLSLPRPPTYSRRPSSPPPTELVPAPTSPAPMPEFVFSVEPPPSSPGSPSIWQIAGSVIGSVVILVLLAWLGKKRRTGKKDSESGDPSNQIAVNMAKPVLTQLQLDL